MTPCIEWTGYKNRDGYGQRFFRGKHGFKAHRAAYIEQVGPIPAGMTIDHLCRNRACVNPDHMEPVTARENTRRGRWATATECVNGHTYDERNTYIRPNGNRDCRACIRERARRYSLRKSA